MRPIYWGSVLAARSDNRSLSPDLTISDVMGRGFQRIWAKKMAYKHQVDGVWINYESYFLIDVGSDCPRFVHVSFMDAINVRRESSIA